MNDDDFQHPERDSPNALLEALLTSLSCTRIALSMPYLGNSPGALSRKFPLLSSRFFGPGYCHCMGLLLTNVEAFVFCGFPLSRLASRRFQVQPVHALYSVTSA